MLGCNEVKNLSVSMNLSINHMQVVDIEITHTHTHTLRFIQTDNTTIINTVNNSVTSNISLPNSIHFFT